MKIPFDLERFKAGDIALTRDGREAEFLYYNEGVTESSQLGAIINTEVYAFHSDGSNRKGSEFHIDLVAMKPKAHKHQDLIGSVYEFMVAADQPPKDFETALVYEPIIQEEMREFWDGFELVKQNPLSHRARMEHLDGIVDTMWTLIAQALAMGYDIEGAMAEVARSNMSKVDGGVIRKTPSGKVVKPEGYSPPNLKGFV